MGISLASIFRHSFFCWASVSVGGVSGGEDGREETWSSFSWISIVFSSMVMVEREAKRRSISVTWDKVRIEDGERGVRTFNAIAVEGRNAVRFTCLRTRAGQVRAANAGCATHIVFWGKRECVLTTGERAGLKRPDGYNGRRECSRFGEAN